MAKKAAPRPQTPAGKPGRTPAKPRRAAPKAAARTDVFISYSHKDKKWLDRVKVHLKPLERNHGVTIWQDTKLRGGDRWRAEIDQALASTRVAVLLISADFLASDFIAHHELPPLLKAAAKSGALILPVIISDSAFPDSELAIFQAINSTDQPLNTLQEGQVEQVLVQLYRRIRDAYHEAPKPAAAPRKPTTTLRAKPTATPTPAPAPKAKPEAAPKGALDKPKALPPARTLTRSAATKSQLALLVNQRGEWATLPLLKASLGTTLDLILQATTAEQRAYLNQLRQRSDLLGFVIGTDTHLARLTELKMQVEGSTQSWHLSAQPTDRPPPTEMTYNGITPAMQAQSRARLLLLNDQNPAGDRGFSWGGGNLPTPPDSPLLTLYQQVSSNVTEFNRLAPLIATWFLHLTAVVEDILTMKITARGKQARIEFRGRRKRTYDNEPADEISVSGQLHLQSAVPGTERLLLGPLRRW